MTVRNLEYLFRPTSVAVVFEPDEASRYAEVMLGNLAAGGYGFILGDGKLNYGWEWVTEAYYKVNMFYSGFWLTADYQFVVNPGYNLDRGPVSVFTLRAHIEL